MEATIKRDFLDALRGNTYKQGRGALKAINRQGEVCHCPNGILAEMATAAGIVDEPVLINADGGKFWRWGANASFLPEDVREWAGMTMWESSRLIRMNDIKGYTFDEIADVVEEW